MSRVVVRNELERIYLRDGALEPSVIVAEAAEEDSPLHRYFDWDDTTAAEAWRLSQASQLIRSVKIRVQVAPEATHRVRAYLSVPRDDGRHYEAIADVLADGAARDVVFQECVRELAALRHKYVALTDVDKAWTAAAAQKKRRRSKVA